MWNKIKAFIWINSKSGIYITTLRNETLGCLLWMENIFCEVKVLLLPTIFITLFFLLPVRLYGGFLLYIFFSFLLRKFSPNFQIWIVYGAKGCEKCFFDLVFLFGLTVIRDLGMLEYFSSQNANVSIVNKARDNISVYIGMNNNGFLFSATIENWAIFQTEKVTELLHSIYMLMPEELVFYST